MKIIILDGYNAGEVADYPGDTPPLLIQVERPASITNNEFFESSKTVDELFATKKQVLVQYKLTFVSVDGAVALYTTEGTGECFISNRFILTNFTTTTDSASSEIESNNKGTESVEDGATGR